MPLTCPDTHPMSQKGQEQTFNIGNDREVGRCWTWQVAC